MLQEVLSAFRQMYRGEPLVVSAPGRVNLIGEHTDYNEGFVLPGAVDKNIWVALAENGTQRHRVYAKQFDESFEFNTGSQQPQQGWLNYVLGVLHFTREKSGRDFGGVDFFIDGDIPVGAGMSSSAALCSALGFALNECFGFGLSRLELALIGQQTEHQFAGVQCGIMDQFASLHGKKDFLLKLDCRSLEYETVPFDFPDYSIVLVNTMVHHSLASSEYNVRRKQCEEGVAIIKKYYPHIRSLRDVPFEQLARRWQEFPAVVYERCSYVINENQRLLAACDALRQNDLKGFGEMMYASHKGLSRRYEVSCPELDFLVDETRNMPSVTGARMMGGGFGGCTINIVEAGGVDAFTNNIRQAYFQKFGIRPDVFITRIEDGARRHL